MSWSYDLLSEPDRAVFRRLSVFPDGFTLSAAEVIGQGDPVVAGTELEIVTRLVEKSLLATVRGADASLRYRMLETLRQYAAHHLDSAGEADWARECLLTWALELVGRVEDALRTPRQDAAMREAGVERLNLRAAFEWAMAKGDLVRALRIAAAVPLGLDSERQAVLTDLLQRVPDAPASVRGHAWATMANLAIDRGDADAAMASAREYLAAAQQDGDRVHQVWARYFLAHGYWGAGRHADLDRLIGECLAEFDALGLAHGSAYMKWMAALTTDDPVEGVRLASEAESTFRQLGMRSGLAHAVEGRALLELKAGNVEEARPALAEAVEIVASAGNAGCTAHCLEAVAAYAAELGWLDDAVELVDAAEHLRGLTGHGHRVWESEGHRRALAALGDQSTTIRSTPAAAPHTLASAAAFALAVLARLPNNVPE